MSKSWNKTNDSEKNPTSWEGEDPKSQVPSICSQESISVVFCLSYTQDEKIAVDIRKRTQPKQAFSNKPKVHLKPIKLNNPVPFSFDGTNQRQEPQCKHMQALALLSLIQKIGEEYEIF